MLSYLAVARPYHSWKLMAVELTAHALEAVILAAAMAVMVHQPEPSAFLIAFDFMIVCFFLTFAMLLVYEFTRLVAGVKWVFAELRQWWHKGKETDGGESQQKGAEVMVRRASTNEEDEEGVRRQQEVEDVNDPAEGAVTWTVHGHDAGGFSGYFASRAPSSAVLRPSSVFILEPRSAEAAPAQRHGSVDAPESGVLILTDSLPVVPAAAMSFDLSTAEIINPPPPAEGAAATEEAEPEHAPSSFDAAAAGPASVVHEPTTVSSAAEAPAPSPAPPPSEGHVSWPRLRRSTLHAAEAGAQIVEGPDQHAASAVEGPMLESHQPSTALTLNCSDAAAAGTSESPQELVSETATAAAPSSSSAAASRRWRGLLPPMAQLPVRQGLDPTPRRGLEDELVAGVRGLRALGPPPRRWN